MQCNEFPLLFRPAEWSALLLYRSMLSDSNGLCFLKKSLKEEDLSTEAAEALGKQHSHSGWHRGVGRGCSSETHTLDPSGTSCMPLRLHWPL